MGSMLVRCVERHQLQAHFQNNKISAPYLVGVVHARCVRVFSPRGGCFQTVCREIHCRVVLVCSPRSIAHCFAKLTYLLFIYLFPEKKGFFPHRIARFATCTLVSRHHSACNSFTTRYKAPRSHTHTQTVARARTKRLRGGFWLP